MRYGSLLVFCDKIYNDKIAKQ